MMQNVICVKKNTNKTVFINDDSVSTWAWGKNLETWNIYVITEGEIIHVPLESFNVMELSQQVEQFIKETCQG